MQNTNLTKNQWKFKQKSNHNQSNIDQESTKNHATINQNSINIEKSLALRLGSRLGGLLERLGRVLERLGLILERLGGVLGVSGSAWERLGAADHRWLCRRAGPGPETTRSG